MVGEAEWTNPFFTGEKEERRGSSLPQCAIPTRRRRRKFAWPHPANLFRVAVGRCLISSHRMTRTRAQGKL